MTVPNSRRNLDEAIKRLAEKRDETPIRIRDVIANTVVAQMLPSSVVKGGSAIKLRLGDAGTRFTTDLDVARADSLDTFSESLRESLERGWMGFTGRYVIGKPAHPKDVPPWYVMQPFDIKLSYNNKSWCTVRLEVGHNEIGDADEADFYMAKDVADIFLELGFPKPSSVPLMQLHYQIAQKLHALTEPGSRRAHDLIDLQLLVANEKLDYALINKTCKRLFMYRQMQAWPSYVAIGDGWKDTYDTQRNTLAVLDDVQNAIRWVNDFIDRINAA